MVWNYYEYEFDGRIYKGNTNESKKEFMKYLKEEVKIKVFRCAECDECGK